MESLDLLNLGADECSFLEITLADVRRYINIITLESKKHVLVFPPLNARKRFLIHTVVQNFFIELNTISIGSSYGRRTVVYHFSLKPMFRQIEELEESDELHNEYVTSEHRAYRTPSERKAQEKLLQSLMPKKKVDKSSMSTQRKQLKRPDIPIYIPKARREAAINNIKTLPNISNNTFSSNSTPPSKLDSSSEIKNDSKDTLKLKKIKGSFSELTLNNQQPKCELTSLNKILVNNEFQSSFNDISETPSNVLDIKNEDKFNPDLPLSNEILRMRSPTLEYNGLESNFEGTDFSNSANDSIVSDIPECSSDNVNITSIQNSMLANLPSFQISNINNEIVADNTLESQEIRKLNPNNVDTNIITDNENIIENISNKQEIQLESEVDDSNTCEINLTEFDTNCINYSLDDNYTSRVVEKNDISENEEIAVQQSSEFIKMPIEMNRNEEKRNKIQKEKKKKKVLDVDECSWEDLYDKEDDYIHPLLMKELITTMGQVQVHCAKENYRNYQTIEERSGDGECVIEVYGFSSDLKTLDLMNQFAEFRKNHFEIVWVNDTHALAVFESPNLADRALNTSFVLVKTRPLKNAIKESKIKAETIAPLPATRPKTCTAMARRLVSSALGLKMNVSPDLLSAERKLLANAKEKKIRDAQQKHDVWNDES